MNVEDVISKAPVVLCRLSEIFTRQRELMEKYHSIEERNGIGRGVVKDTPFDLDDHRWQYLVKDFAWRTTEEIGEALDAYRGGGFDHAKEEVADGLHFLVEAGLIIGMSEDHFCALSPEWEGGPDRLIRLWNKTSTIKIAFAVTSFIRSLGMTMCCLKNKPWKQTHFATDVMRFRGMFCQTFLDYLCIAKAFGMTDQELYEMYFKKNQVNHFRINSKY